MSSIMPRGTINLLHVNSFLIFVADIYLLFSAEIINIYEVNVNDNRLFSIDMCQQIETNFIL